jgi:hypothetical protein
MEDVTAKRSDGMPPKARYINGHILIGFAVYAAVLGYLESDWFLYASAAALFLCGVWARRSGLRGMRAESEKLS